MAFTKEQRAAWRNRPEVKAHAAAYTRQWKIENDQTQYGPIWSATWFVKYWEEKEQKKRESAARREAEQQSRPVEIRGIKPKDMTKEQRSIWAAWSHRNSPQYFGIRTPEQKKRRTQTARRYQERRRLAAIERRKTDIAYKLLLRIRNRLWHTVRGNRASHAKDLVGCTLTYLKAHLEAQFKGCMSWDNYGKAWHIDHIVPCRYFDLSTERGKRHCFHYTNLRPLWKKTNLGRFKKGVPVQQELPFGQ
jgi:hypothetical protein